MPTSNRELNLDKEAFLAKYWQRRPLLIRQAIPNFSTPLGSDELAGLALEDEIESRVIETLTATRAGERATEWALHHGPFAEDDLQRDGAWTLLVQAVDHYIPEVAELRQLVDFIPQWRVDDVMASYATDGGSVGPHYDNYDVFLLQGEGHRLWRIGQACDQKSPLLDHDELRILDEFECTQEYLLGPGDMLYVPPGIAHWGIAQGECTTFSIGFRAPRINDMVSRFSDSLLEHLPSEAFYRDEQLDTAKRAGEISRQDLQRIHSQLEAALASEGVGDWFGELVTEPRYEYEPDEGELATERSQLLAGGCRVILNPASKLAWQQNVTSVSVYANGESRLFTNVVASILVTVCGQWALEGPELAAVIGEAEGAQLLDYLLERGCIYVEQSDPR